MAKSKTVTRAVSAPPAPVAPESPLVPHATLRRMYEEIVQSRLLAEALRPRHRVVEEIGQEAARVATLLDLTPEDFISDLPGTVTTAFLRDGTLPASLRTGSAAAGKTASKPPSLLPAPDEPELRFALALGAAVAIKRLQAARIVVLFANAGEARPSLWRQALCLAARHELPILFVVLPQAKGDTAAPSFKPFALSARATATGVPGIPVEGSDAVALYRVAQESIGRARAGGGPALMECIRFTPDGAKKSPRIDPLDAMSRTLLTRGIAAPQWLAQVAPTFKARLKASRIS